MQDNAKTNRQFQQIHPFVYLQNIQNQTFRPACLYYKYTFDYHQPHSQMETYQGIRLNLKIPELLSRPEALLEITNLTHKLTSYVKTQSLFIKKTHSIFNQICLSTQKLCNKYEKNLQNVSSQSSSASRYFLKTIFFLFYNLSQQSFKNQVSLKTFLKTEQDQSLVHSINKKSLQINESLNEYNHIYHQYSKKQLKYIQQCQIFDNFFEDALKYYQIKPNTIRTNQVIQLQFDLQKSLLKLKQSRFQIQLFFKQYQKLLFQLFVSKIKIVHMSLGLLHQALMKLVSTNDIIIEQGSRDEITSVNDDNLVIDYRIGSPEQMMESIKNMLKNQKMVINVIQQFLVQFIKVIEQAYNELRGSQIKKLNLSLKRWQFLIQEKISCRIFINNIESDHQILIFQELIQILRDNLRSSQILSTQKTSQQNLINKLQADLKNFSNTLPNGNSIKDNPEIYKYYLQMITPLRKKYVEDIQNISNSFKLDLSNLSNQINNQFRTVFSRLKRTNSTQPSKNQITRRVKKILKSKSYTIFKDPFLLNYQQYQFVRSPQIISYLKYREESHAEGFSLNNSSEVSENKNICIENLLCCGAKKNKKIIDEYNCALVDRILLQGKLKLFKNFIIFSSAFNKLTLFGKTQLKIPKSDIMMVTKNDNYPNGITVETLHGNISFASFLNSPLVLMRAQYQRQPKSILRKGEDHPILRQPQMILKERILKCQMVSQFLIRGFCLKSPSRMQKQSSQFTSVMNIQQDSGDYIFIKIQYLVPNRPTQFYSFSVIRTGQGKLQIKYSFGENNTFNFKSMFIQLVGSLVEGEKGHLHDTRSQIFDISSFEGNQELFAITKEGKQLSQEKDSQDKNNISPILTKQQSWGSCNMRADNKMQWTSSDQAKAEVKRTGQTEEEALEVNVKVVFLIIVLAFMLVSWF